MINIKRKKKVLKFKVIIVLLLVVLFVSVAFWPQSTPNENSDIDFIRGNNAMFNQEYDLARQYYLADLQYNPDRFESLNNLSTTFIKGNDQSIIEAIKYTKRLINHPAMADQIDIPLLKSVEKLGMSKVLDQLKETLQSDLLLAQAWFSEDPNKAKEHIIKVPEAEKSLDYYRLSAQIHLSTGDFQRSLDDINHAIGLQTFDSQIYFLKSQALLRSRQMQQAQIATQVYRIVKAFEKIMTSAERLEKLQQVFKLEPSLQTNVAFMTPYIVVLIELGQHARAQESFDALDMTSLSSIDKISLLSAAVKHHHIPIVEGLYTQTNALTVSAGEAILYCQTLHEIMRLNQVINYCQQAVERFPDIAPLQFWYGMALLSNDDMEAAIENIALAIDYSPWVDDWRLHLAQIYLTEGKKQSAIKVLDESISGNSALISQFKKKNGL